MENITEGNFDNVELEKSKPHIIVEIIEYVSTPSFDKGEGLYEKTSPFDTFIQIIEGRAEIVIDSVSNQLETGHSIIVPAHLPNYIMPHQLYYATSAV